MADIVPSEIATPFVDHTCVTPFERFAHAIEQHLRAWNIQSYSETTATPSAPSPPPTSSSIKSLPPLSPVRQRTSRVFESAQVTFRKKRMFLQLRDVQNPKEDSGLNGAALERFLGVTTCVYLSPVSKEDGPVAKNACEASVLLSALVLAATESQCKIPIIVPIGDAAEMDFMGRNPYKNVRYVCGSVPYPPPAVSHAAGLLELFASKRMASRPLQFGGFKYKSSLLGNEKAGYVYITACFHYLWKSFLLLLNSGYYSFMHDKYLKYFHESLLTDSDPVREVEIKAVWNRFPAKNMGSDPSRWSFPPLSADMWCMKANFRDSSYDFDSNYPLTKRLASINSLADLARRRYKDSCAAPLSFVDVGSDYGQFLHVCHNYLVAWNVEKVQGIDPGTFVAGLGALLSDGSSPSAEKVSKALAPAPMELDSAQRLARLISLAEERPRVFRKLWGLYLDGVSSRWDAKMVIPCLASTHIDHGTVLLRQKLQMVNCCIARRLKAERERGIRGEEVTNFDPSSQAWDDAWSTDGEDAQGTSVNENGSLMNDHIPEMNGKDKIHDHGRKRVISGTYLQQASGEQDAKIPMYEPFLQDHPLMTSDEIGRLSSELSDPSLSHTDRARLQSYSLVSDMSAFKAANEDAKLVDFVQWFSPADLENNSSNANAEANENEGLERSLSERMRTPGNLWEELWENAPTIAAEHQEQLFNPTESGLKALGDLRAMSLTQVIDQLAVLFASEVIKIFKSALQKQPTLKPVLHELSKTSILADRAVASSHCSSELTESIMWCERAIIRAAAIAKRIPVAQVDDVADRDGSERSHIIGTMCTGAEVKVRGIQQRRAIGVMAGIDEDGNNTDKDSRRTENGERWRNMLLPHAREFVFEAPGTESGSGVEQSFANPTDRMYARNEEDEFTVGLRLSLDYRA